MTYNSTIKYSKPKLRKISENQPPVTANFAPPPVETNRREVAPSTSKNEHLGEERKN